MSRRTSRGLGRDAGQVLSTRTRHSTGVAPAVRRAVAELLEPRLVLATFSVAAGDTAGLIAAINSANAVAGADTVNLTAGSSYTLTAQDNFWYGPNGLPAITSDVTISGNGATIARSAAAGTPKFRLFYVAGTSTVSPTLTPGTLTLQNLTLQGGLAKGGDGGTGGGGGLGAGGAVFNHGSLTLDGVLATGNTAQGGASLNPGGINLGGGGGIGGDGGGLSGIVGAGAGGGGFGGSGGTPGYAGGGSGGGGYAGNGGSGTGVFSPVNSNSGGGGGGQTGNGADANAIGGGAGGGPNGGTAGVAGNGGNGGAGGGGGGAGGAGAAGGNGGAFGGGGGGGQSAGGGGKGGNGGFAGGGGGGGYSNGGQGGTGGVGGGGGGSGGTGAGGAGGFGGGGGGGGQLNGAGANGGFGGGGGAAGGSFAGVTPGTSAFGGGTGGPDDSSRGGGGAGLGGAVFNDGGTVTVTNSTLTANAAVGGAGANNGKGLGGGIFSRNGSVTLTHATLSANTAADGARGLYLLGDGAVVTASVSYSILGQADNSVSDLVTSVINAGGSSVGSNRVLVRSTVIPVDNVSAADPLLAPLNNNGGPTRTVGLLAGSPGIDAATTSTAATDQRGIARPSGAARDVGAFERRAAFRSLAITGGNNQTAPLTTAFASPLSVRVTDDAGAPVAGEAVAFVAPGAGASATFSPSANPVTNAAGDASVTATATGATGTYNVTAADANATVTFTLTNDPVPNVAPSGVAFGFAGPGTAVEGTPVTLTGSFTDPDAGQAHTVAVAWGDGTTVTVTTPAGTTTFSAVHTYLDDNPTGTALDATPVTVTVTDTFATTASATQSLPVANAVPAGLTVSPTAAAIDEGGTVTITGSFTDAGTVDVHTVHVDWADGSPVQDVVLPVGARAFTVSHAYTDDGASPGNGTASDAAIVTVRVTDDDGGSTGTAVSNVTVNNLAPANVTVAATSFFEGTAGTLTGSFTDAGALDAHVVVVDFNDGTAAATQTLAAGVTTFTAVHSFVDDGASPGNGTPSDLQGVSVTVTDDDGGTATGGGTVTVNNVAPGGFIITSATLLNENDALTVTGAVSDPGVADAHTVVVNWGDATATTLTLAAGTTTFGTTHQYLDDGPFPGNGTPSDVAAVTVVITDDDTGSVTLGPANTTISNVAPSAVTIAPVVAAVDEDGTATVTGSFADPGTKDVHVVALTWADGSADSVVTLAAGVTTFSATHQYLDDGASPGNGTASDAYTVSATVSDDDTGVSAPATAVVTVNNVAPSNLVLTAPAAVNEMQAFTLSGTFADPGTLDVHTVTINWADASPAQTLTLAAGVTTFSATHTYVDDNPGTGPADVNTIGVTVADDDTGVTSGTKAVQVKNVAPSAQNTGDATGVPGQLRTITVGATDVSPVDQAAGFRWTIDFGDGTPVQVIANGTSPTAVQHAWGKTGTFTITVRATDKDLGTSVAAKRAIVIKQVDLQADPSDSTKTALVVGGTSGNDKIEILPVTGGKVRVKVGGVDKGTFSPTGKLIVYGNDGADTITITSTKSAWVFGGKGADVIKTNAGNDFVDGGAGNDKIYGGAGRDVLFGGGDADQLFGEAGDDVLVAALSLASTPVPFTAAIAAIQAEWLSASSYAERADHLVNGDGLNGSVRLAPDTVSSDPKAADSLTGGGDRDLFYLNPATVGTSKDKVIDLAAGEIRVFVGDAIP